MKRIRVLIGGLPGVLADVVSQLLGTHADIEVVGRSGHAEEALAATVREVQPDVLILELENAELPPDVVTLLRQVPTLRVLGVTRDQGQGFMYVMRPRRAALGELSAAGLVTAVREAGHYGGS